MKLKKVQVWIHGLDKDGRRKVLLFLTNKERGEFWQPVTGSVENKESFEAAACREAEEETGLTFSSNPKPIGFQFDFESPRGKVSESVFELILPSEQINQDVRLDPHEHVRSIWVSPEEALGLLKFESNAKALSILMSKWRKG